MFSDNFNQIKCVVFADDDRAMCGRSIVRKKQKCGQNNTRYNFDRREKKKTIQIIKFNWVVIKNKTQHGIDIFVPIIAIKQLKLNCATTIINKVYRVIKKAEEKEMLIFE